MHQTRALRLAILLAVSFLLIAQFVTTKLMLERARDAQQTASIETVERVAHGVEASINRAFVQVDAMLAALPAVLSPFADDGVLDASVVNRLLQELNNQSFTYRDVVLARLDGTPVAAALPLSRRRRLPLSLQTDFAQVAARGGTVSIGGPVKNPATGEWALFFARSLNIPGFGPVMGVAEMPLPLVQTLLGVGGTRAGLRVSLERGDGKLIASLPHDEGRIGRTLAPVPEQGPDRAVILTPSRLGDGDTYLLTQPTLYPALSVVTTLDVDTALAGWMQDRRLAWLASSVIGVLMLAVAATLIFVLRLRERAEAERGRARITLESALESMSDGFVMFDANDRLVACNSRYRDFYRVSAHLIVPGAYFDDLMREGARLGQYPQAGDNLEAFVRSSKAFHLGNKPPMERLLPDGRWVLITERRTPDGGTVGIRTDITPLKAAMVELAAARDAAAAAGEAKMSFLARMSHELRTPLNGILGFAQVLLDDARLAHDQRDQIRILHGAGRHLLELVNGLLDLSKIEAGRMELEPRPVPLPQLLSGCVDLLRTEVARRSLDLRTEFDTTLPAAVMVDPTRLRQMLLNLLSNAVKFAPQRGVVVLSARNLGDGEVRFEVRDNGPGVPEHQRLRLFQDFVQLAAHGAGGADGTGLGLAITARLARMMGGRIGCGDAPEGGSLFWIEIPLRVAEVPEAESAPALPRTSRALHLLVVDDIAANREVAGALLRADGHSTEAVQDGASAIARLARGGIDAVLMDLQMPGMDGLEATRRIRALPPPFGDVPVLAVTASALPEQVEACRRAGMDGHLAKPIERYALAQALAQLRLAPAPSPLAAPAAAAPPAPPGDLLDGKTIPTLERELGATFAAEIIGEFAAELAQVRDLLERGVEEAVALRQAAHRVVGAARNLGAGPLAEQALALEHAAKEGEHGTAISAGVVQCADATLAAVRDYLAAAEAIRSEGSKPAPATVMPAV